MILLERTVVGQRASQAFHIRKGIFCNCSDQIQSVSYMYGAVIRDSLCRDDADMPMLPYTYKKLAIA